MTAPVEHRTSASDGGKGRWIARCTCKWWTPCTGAEDASRRMDDHRRVARALHLLNGHACWFVAEMERGPAKDCPACQLEPVLKGRVA